MDLQVIHDDKDSLDIDVNKITIIWPGKKPIIGVIQDYEQCPRWTKYCRTLEFNNVPYEIYDIKASDWLEKAHRYDAVIGVESNEIFALEQLRRKYYILEKYEQKMLSHL